MDFFPVRAADFHPSTGHEFKEDSALVWSHAL